MIILRNTYYHYVYNESIVSKLKKPNRFVTFNSENNTIKKAISVINYCYIFND